MSSKPRINFSQAEDLIFSLLRELKATAGINKQLGITMRRVARTDFPEEIRAKREIPFEEEGILVHLLGDAPYAPETAYANRLAYSAPTDFSRTDLEFQKFIAWQITRNIARLDPGYPLSELKPRLAVFSKRGCFV
jgi:hypothetical protein